MRELSAGRFSAGLTLVFEDRSPSSRYKTVRSSGKAYRGYTNDLLERAEKRKHRHRAGGEQHICRAETPTAGGPALRSGQNFALVSHSLGLLARKRRQLVQTHEQALPVGAIRW